ncbi:MAG: hypothetical protein K5918_07670 [Bacteroidales bacterium]|nr:hypothetical protein [Bacteroidales bacterium]
MKHTSIHHFFALAFLAMSSVLFLSSWMSSRIEDCMTLFILHSIATIAVGYARPHLSKWARWIVLIFIYVTASMVSSEEDWGVSWMAMLLCLFTWTISIRRFVMQQTGNTTVAKKSLMSELYNLLDDRYRNIASSLDKKLKTDTFVTMIPVTHAAAIMSFSLLFLFIGMDSYEPRIEEYGYAVYAGVMAVIPILYTIRNIRQGYGFLSSLLAAFVMLLVGVVAMIMCFIVAIIAFVAINTLFKAISNLLKKLFGD